MKLYASCLILLIDSNPIELAQKNSTLYVKSSIACPPLVADKKKFQKTYANGLLNIKVLLIVAFMLFIMLLIFCYDLAIRNG